MPDVIITPSSGIIDFYPGSTRVGRIDGSGNIMTITNPSGYLVVSSSGISINSSSPNAMLFGYSSTSGATLFNLEGTNGSLFSVVDSLSGSLMSVNNNAGLPVFEVFSDDKIVAGRFGQNDFIMTSGGNIGVGTGVPSTKFHVVGNSTFGGDVTTTGSFIASSGSAALPSYEFVSDSDTGFFSPSDNIIGFATSGIERLRISNIGNIGIGTQTPSGQLHVVGDTYIDNSSKCYLVASGYSKTMNYIWSATNGNLQVNGGGPHLILSSQGGYVDLGGTASTYINIGQSYSAGTTNQYIKFAPANTEAMRITTSGYVGIGTSSPTSQLHVVGSGLFASGLNISNQTASTIASFDSSKNLISLDTGTYPSLTELSYVKGVTSSIQTQINNKQATLTNPVTGTGTASYIPKWSSTSGLSNSLIYDNGTNVGIGTSSPGSPLTISSSNAAGTIAGTSQTQIFQVNDASSADYVNLGHFNVESNVSRGSFMLSNNGTNGAWEDNVIQFFVHGSQYPYGYYGGNSTDAGCAIMTTQGSDITKLQIGNYGAAPIEFFTSNIFRMIIDSDGNVGIGTTIPSGKLDVNGNVNIDGNLTFDSFTESVVANGNSGTSKTLSLASGTVHTCTLTGNCTFTMPTATAGKSFSMFLNSGSGNYTASFSGVRWADSATPTATITASKVDIYSFISDGTYWYGSFSQNYG